MERGGSCREGYAPVEAGRCAADLTELTGVDTAGSQLDDGVGCVQTSRLAATVYEAGLRIGDHIVEACGTGVGSIPVLGVGIDVRAGVVAYAVPVFEAAVVEGCLCLGGEGGLLAEGLVVAAKVVSQTIDIGCRGVEALELIADVVAGEREG